MQSAIEQLQAELVVAWGGTEGATSGQPALAKRSVPCVYYLVVT